MMTEAVFGQYLQKARAHWQPLYARTALPPADQDKLLDETLQELSTAMEETQVANEELRDQSDLLASAHCRYEAAFHGALDAYLVTDKFGTIVEANRAAAVLLHYPVDHVKRKPLIIFLRADSRPAFLDELAHSQASDPHHESTYRVQPHLAPSFPAAVTVSVVQDAETGQIRLHWLMRDVSERWQAEKRMREPARLAIVLQEQDRKRVSETLSADIGQTLAALYMNLNAVSKTLPPEMASTRTRLESISVQLKETVIGIEALARGLYPPTLDLLGLVPTLRNYCDGFA